MGSRRRTLAAAGTLAEMLVAVLLIVSVPDALAGETRLVYSDWLLTLEYDELPSSTFNCLLYVEADADSLSGGAVCGGSLSSGRFTGSVDEDAFSMTLRFDGETAKITGNLPTDDGGILGTWQHFDEEGLPIGVGGGVEGFGLHPNYASRWGDMNCDGTINSLDARYVLMARSTWCRDEGASIPTTMLPNIMAAGADGNLDGSLDSFDALLILQVDARLIERLPVL